MGQTDDAILDRVEVSASFPERFLVSIEQVIKISGL